MLIALPAYNESSVITNVIESLRAEEYSNIVVIDDGSMDNTAQVVRSLGVPLVRLPINRGVGAAFRAAIQYAQYHNAENLVLMDADGQHYPEDIKGLFYTLQNSNADIIIGSRFLDSNYEHIPFIRRVYNKIANWITYLGERNVTDSQSGFRILNQNAIQNLDLECDDYAVCSEMIWKAKRQGLQLKEAPIRVRYTEYSLSKGQNLWKGVKTMVSLVRKW